MKTINITNDINEKTRLQLVSDLENLKISDSDELQINIMSYGGDYFEAIHMRDIINRYSNKKNILISGISASAANSIVFNLKNVEKIQITPGSYVMLHLASSGGFENSIEKIKTAEVLNKIDNDIVTYILNKLKIKKSREEIYNHLVDEWWLSADELASDFGFELLKNEKTDFENLLKNKTDFQTTKMKLQNLTKPNKSLIFQNAYKKILTKTK